MNMKFNVIYCVLCVIIHNVYCITKPTTMIFENNQFKNMVIAFHDSIPADKTLIDTLKSHMTDASTFLLKATNNRAYFKTITLLLPSTWPDDPSYGTATTETLNMADVIITDTVRPTRSLPRTRSYSGCGTPGVHILMSLDFLTKPRAEPYYLMPGKYFIHAFAQFRWGVFQEYAETGESLFYFSLTSGHPEAIRCVYYLRGLVQKNDANQTICYTSIDPNTGLYTPDCLWRPYPTRQRAKASMMDHQWIQAIETFCNDDTQSYLTIHNYEAPSKHNRLCGHRSTWDVISNSPDFSNGKNPTVQNTSPSSLVPTFNIIKLKARRKRAVVVVDDHFKSNQREVSEMMARLHQEIKFHNIEMTAKNATEYDNEMKNVEEKISSKYDHVIHIKHHCNSETDRFVDNNTASVITTKDGSCRFPVEKVNHRAEGSMAGHTLTDRLRETLLNDDIENNKYVIVHREEITVNAGVVSKDFVFIDPTVGLRTMFMFYYTHGVPRISILAPSGKTYDARSPSYTADIQNNFIQIYIENAEAGMWTFSIQTDKTQHISVLVSTTPVHQPHDPVIVRTHFEPDLHMLTLYVDVTRGTHPVVGLNVTARVETPTGDVEFLHLFDNGAGADITKHDGVYSRHFTHALTDGIYHVSAKVTGAEGEVYISEETYEEVPEESGEDAVPLRTSLTKRSVPGSLQRHVSLGSVMVGKSKFKPTEKDTVPPVRVVDLRVTRHLYYRNTLALSWTAPGDDLDHGKVSSYDIYIGENIKDVRALLQYGDKESTYSGPGCITKETHTAVNMATEMELFLWKIPPSVTTFAFSVRGVDEAGNKANLSNVATFGFVKYE